MSPPKRVRDYRVPLIGSFTVLHLLMLGYDLRHPERFLNADRAETRLDTIQHFVQALHRGDDLAAFISGHGIAGDWLPQALLYIAGGQYLVIAVQALLALLSIVWVRNIGLSLGLEAGRASAAAALYGALPHSLIFPHQLASEAIFVPLVVLSFALCGHAPGFKQQIGGGAALGVANLVRPVTLVWSLVHAAFSRVAPRVRAAYLTVALAPFALWIGFVFLATGEFSAGHSSHDLGHNLYARAHRMTAHLPDGQRALVLPADRRTLNLSEYARFVAQYPGATLAHSARDLATFGLKSGLERIMLDYLDLFPESRAELQDSLGGWRARVERQGPVGALTAIFRGNPALTLASIGGAMLFALLMAFAVLGAYVWLRDGAPAERHRQRILLIAFALYIAATAQVVDAAQSRHRAPAEFVLCLLAAAAVPLLRRRNLEMQHAG